MIFPFSQNQKIHSIHSARHGAILKGKCEQQHSRHFVPHDALNLRIIRLDFFQHCGHRLGRVRREGLQLGQLKSGIVRVFEQLSQAGDVTRAVHVFTGEFQNSGEILRSLVTLNETFAVWKNNGKDFFNLCWKP